MPSPVDSDYCWRNPARRLRPGVGFDSGADRTMHAHALPLLLALAALVSPLDRGRRQRGQGRILPTVFVTCTPDSIQVGGKEKQPSKNPIADALEQAGPGSTIRVQPGDYPGFTLGFDRDNVRNAATSGGLPGRPVTVIGEGLVRLHPKKGEGDTISINQAKTTGHFVFRNLEIEPGYRAGILFFTLRRDRTHVGFHFEDCNIIGSWDHVSNRGKKSKWGVYGHSMSDFVFRGTQRKARIENIQQEHAFYIQNPKGDILIENVEATRLGRTFCQFTAREKDGMVGVGTITVRDCYVEDTGLSKWDGHKGGSAFTVAGRLSGEILFERNTYRAGFHEELHRLTSKQLPYGTGAFVAWDGGEKVPNGRLVLRDNDFEFAKSMGDRPVVSLGGCKEIEILGRNRFVSGGEQAALSFDPPRGPNPGGKPKSIPNGQVYLDPLTAVEGPIHMRGTDAREDVLETMKVRSDPAPLGGRR